MAGYRNQVLMGKDNSWDNYLSSLANSQNRRFEPDTDAAAQYDKVYARYRSLMSIHGRLDEALTP